MSEVKGYKVFDPEWKCRGFQYEVGKTYEEEFDPICCKRGFHFCLKLADCFGYYEFDPNNKVAEIVAVGKIHCEDTDSKCCTNKIQIEKELTWNEVLDLVNIGKGNTGHRNSGHHNSGNWNSGDRNSGHHNSGYHNSGDYNIVSHISGCFNTEEPKLLFFDKPTEITMEQWRNSRAFNLLQKISVTPTTWVHAESMTDEEKEKNPSWETTKGYLKKEDGKNCFLNAWNALTQEEKEIIQQIPNFDPEKFYLITGIQV